MISFHPVNQLIMTSETTQPQPSPWTSSSLWVNKICMSGLGAANRIFFITTGNKYQYQLTLIHLRKKIQQSTKEVLCNELEWYFRSIKSINWCQQVWTPNQKPCHSLTEACGWSKSICLVRITPKEDLISHLRKIIMMNKLLYYQYKQTSQK